MSLSPPSTRPAATPLSGRTPLATAFCSLFPGLAHLSLLLACLGNFSACLVDDPPPYAAPRKTPPRLDTTNAQPLLDQVIVANSGDILEFSVPITSEDAGDDLFGILLLNYAGEGSVPTWLNGIPLPASTLDDPTPRILKLVWTIAPMKAGCHRVTLRVTHTSNLSRVKPVEVNDRSDLAEAYWFANINVDPELANSLMECPLGSARNQSP